MDNTFVNENSYDNPKNVELRDAFVGLETALGKANEIVPSDAAMPDIDWIFDGTSLVIRSPFLMSQFLMQALSHGTHSMESFFMDEKLFWMQVANEMGPDYLKKLRRVAAFMDKVEEF